MSTMVSLSVKCIKYTSNLISYVKYDSSYKRTAFKSMPQSGAFSFYWISIYFFSQIVQNRKKQQQKGMHQYNYGANYYYILLLIQVASAEVCSV